MTMKRISVSTLAIAGIILLASCKSGKNVQQILSKSATRLEVMNTIANSANMSEEMKEVMFKKENASLIIKETFDEMGKMMDPKIKTDKYKSDHGINSTQHSTCMVN
jgi:ABC-type metal ion transport system substrate-binding protein